VSALSALAEFSCKAKVIQLDTQTRLAQSRSGVDAPELYVRGHCTDNARSFYATIYLAL
jgi:hypothetical protein